MNYKRLDKRLKELCKLYNETQDVKYAMESESVCIFFECRKDNKYEFILNFANKHNLKRIYDIGCAYGHQSEVFLNQDVDYIGIEMAKIDFWNNDKFKYIVGNYPFKIDTNKDDLAVSVLCLTWNCYLYEGEETLRKQCEQLQKDFKHCLLYLPKEKIEFVKKYFKYHKILEEGFVYFYN